MGNVATQLVESLADAGVRRTYGAVGDPLNGIMDAVHENRSIARVHVRHDELKGNLP